MKRFGLLCCLMSMPLVLADSLDNALLEELQASRDTQRTLDKNLFKRSSQTHGKSHARSPFRNHIIEDSKAHKELYADVDEPYRPIVWFVGLGGEMQAPKKIEDPSLILSANLHFGIFAHLTREQGFRFAFMGGYNFLQDREFYSIGGVIDYFYNINIKKGYHVGFFAGASAYMPFKTIIDTPNVSARAGIGMAANGLRFELYGGYPLYQDPKLTNMLVFGINLSMLL